ncbi:MAG TPA: hypothetical protein PLT87_08960 [Spirochaetales bacterium]|nr:hypothetical protein [Spirochaetales bacterium]
MTLHWPFDDPARFEGSDEEIMVRVRQVRDAIAKKVKEFVDTWPEVESAAAQGSPTEDLSAKTSPTHGSTAQDA